MSSSRFCRSCIMLLLTIFNCTHTTTSSSNETDLQALLQFKASIDLDSSRSLASWNQTTHFCRWNGVRCGQRHRDRVVEIDLMSQGLVGSLSPHIGNLSFLRTLTLANNSFHGQIPQEICQLRRIVNIHLSNNSFSGSIPRNLSLWPNLVNLNLQYNELTGSIPHEISSLHKLRGLYLSRNNLSGNIPPSIGNLTSLVILTMSYCRLEGEIPESFTNLKSLSYFSLGINSLTGIVPLGMFNISTINTFDVNSNQLEGEIPSDIGLTLPNVRGLFLGDNGFTGMIPNSLSNASNLEVIVLLLNTFIGPMPKLGGLLHLRDFVAAKNHISDDISFITSLTNCTNLRFLEIGDNRLFGSLPNSVGNLSITLEVLAIGYNQLHGIIPSGIGNLVGLTSLRLEANSHDGPITSHIGKLRNLRRFSIQRNALTNELPSSFSNLTALISLYLSSNYLSGSIQVLSNCTNLLELVIYSNNFSGAIPSILHPDSTLISIAENAFTGSIPSEVGSLTNLIALDMSHNRLSGLVPNSLSQCRSLQNLYLQENSLEGEITPWLTELENLQILNLSRNNFSGPIPSSITNFSIQILNLAYNRLQGEVPTQGIFRNATAVFLDGNNELCGGIIELDLPPCSFPSTKRSSTALLKKILIPSACILFAISLGFIIFIYRRKKNTKRVALLPSLDTNFIRLSYANIMKATDGFSSSNLIGRGRFGTVYKGILDDTQTLIAVKVLNLSVRGASKSFTAECNALRGLRHRNLVKILSVCESIDFHGNSFKALVYEFKANGSLEKWFYHENGPADEENDTESRTLSMSQRLKIAIDIAHALEYLHYGTGTSVIHSDLKPSNILLDQDMNAFVGDFGLAKIVSSLLPEHENNSSLLIKGTIGYIPPEYATSYTVSIQGDVYSYGILLLEMFTNIRPTNDAFEDHINLHNLVSNALPDHVMEIVDPLIRAEHDTNNKVQDCVVSMLSIGVRCSKSVPNDRTLMNDAVNELRKIRDIYLGE